MATIPPPDFKRRFWNRP